MKTEEIVLMAFILLALVGSVGCNDCDNPDPEPCDIATIEAYSTPEDSLCFGAWEWIYTIKWQWSFAQEDWYMADTVYSGQVETGFEALQYVSGTVGKGEMSFNISGILVAGCYHKRNSALFQAHDGPSDTLVGGIFHVWDTPGYGGIVVDAYIPEAQGEPVIAQISGLRMFYVEDEYEAGVRYRNRFVKVE